MVKIRSSDKAYTDVSSPTELSLVRICTIVSTDRNYTLLLAAQIPECQNRNQGKNAVLADTHCRKIEVAGDTKVPGLPKKILLLPIIDFPTEFLPEATKEVKKKRLLSGNYCKAVAE